MPTVSRAEGGTIVELVYDGNKKTTALVVGRAGTWSIEGEVESTTGEKLVPYAASNNLIRHGCVLLPSEPENHESKARLLEDLEAYLHRYVDLSPLFERIATHYVLLSWVFDAFNELPYLRFRGDYGSGKTRALIALGSIAYRGFFASGASTVSPIFHTLDTFGGTLVLDEADLRFSDKTADIVKILNNGTVIGLPVLRTLQNRQKEFNPAAFNVFGPKIIAMRGAFKDPALESRFLTEEMSVRPLRPDISLPLPGSLKAEALLLRNKLLHFRLMHLHSVRALADRKVDGIDPRLNQTALSLLSLIDDAGLRAELAALLHAKQRQLTADRARSGKARTLRIIAEAFREAEQTRIRLRDVADRLNAAGDELDEPMSPRDVGQVLRALAVPLRKSHGQIVIEREDWKF